MQKLPVRQRLLLGFTLFSMFFGAGNLIFPPHLGAQAGSNFWPAFAGFAVSAIGLPIAGVVAVARAGGFDQLASRVHPKFSLVFTILVYLSIGPCLAIPRTASTSFEMLVPLVGGGRGLQLGYSIVFFAAAFLVALHPEKLTDRLGRVLCPALIALIFVLFAGCLLHPVAAQYGSPAAAYARLPAFEGILGGYQTMDALAGLNFGAVLALNIQALGVTEENAIRQNTIRAGFLAGGLLLVIYAMLGHVGALTGAAAPDCTTGAEVLSALASALFGRAGQLLLAAIFLIACFNTCVGLISCVGQYFHTLLPLPGSRGLFRRRQYAHLQHRAGGHHPAVHPGSGRTVSGSHRAHRAVVPAQSVPEAERLRLHRRTDGRAERPCGPAVHRRFRHRPAAGGLWLRLGRPGSGGASGRVPVPMKKCRAAARHFFMEVLFTSAS